MKTFFEELKNRRVYRVALGYVIAGSATVQVVGTVLPIFHAPDWAQQLFVVLIALGFPMALVLAWSFDVEAGTIKKARAGPGGTAVANRRRVWIVAGVGSVIAMLGLGAYWFWHPWTTGLHLEPEAGPAITEKSIAVLPFENLSDDKQNAYFADGVQDEILTNLARVADLKVISRTSVMQYKSGAQRNLRDIAKTLIATAVFSTPQAESLFEAVRLLSQAIERDHAFALAYYQLAHAHDLLYFVGTDHTPARLAMADAAIQSLARLRPNSGEAHLAIAKHLYWGRLDYERARQELTLAQKSLPNDPLPFQLASYIDRRQGRWAESTKNLERAIELDPQNAEFLQQISLTYECLRRYADMERALDRALALTPKDAGLRASRARVER